METNHADKWTLKYVEIRSDSIKIDNFINIYDLMQLLQ